MIIILCEKQLKEPIASPINCSREVYEAKCMTLQRLQKNHCLHLSIFLANKFKSLKKFSNLKTPTLHLNSLAFVFKAINWLSPSCLHNYSQPKPNIHKIGTYRDHHSQVGKFVNCAPNAKRLIKFCAPKTKLMCAPKLK